MIRKSFNAGWTVSETMPFMFMKPGGKPVTLPYDDMLTHTRVKDAPSGSSKGYYPDAVCAFAKDFDVPTEWEGMHVVLEFEGIQANSTVFINGDYAGGCVNGYTKFLVEMDDFLRYGESNNISIVARTTQDSRWYTGVGIYRDVHLMVSGLQHISPDGYRISTPEIDSEGAIATIATELTNLAHNCSTLMLLTKVYDADGVIVAADETPATLNGGTTQTLRQRLYIDSPRLWDAETPHLYRAETVLLSSDVVKDRATSHFGIRQLQLDTRHGLRVNGKTVKLRGACVHHDNGIIGAATIARAEERRVELLKAAGFNAVRSAHNPISRAFLDACDRIGMYVMDELTDIWGRGKSKYDYSTNFLTHWREAAGAMVATDFNHPSVIMYSTGNEIPEIGSVQGAQTARDIAEHIRAIDPTRYTTNAGNFLLALMGKPSLHQKPKAGDVNLAMTNIDAAMASVMASELPAQATQEAFASVDIAGYNYATSRHVQDGEKFPNRVICGSETFPKEIAANWAVITQCNHVIGDFTWTGWDYLGEAAIGRTKYEDEENGIYGDYPWFVAYCGDIDIIGNRRPVSYYREIVFGLRTAPYIAVWYPHTHGKTLVKGKWDFMDGISSWSWHGDDGKPVTVEVYAPGDRVVLLCNGVRVGEAALEAFRASIETVYNPGELFAIAYQGDVEIGRYALQTAGSELKLAVTADRQSICANDKDLAFLSISLTDAAGVVKNTADREVHIEVTGAAILQGLGSAKPNSEESFLANHYTTFDGHALAVIRPTEAGAIHVTVTAEGCEPVTLALNATATEGND